MSLINQVLNELESRGANVPLGEQTIRAVPPRKQSHVMRYVFAAVTLLILLASAKWYLGRTMIIAHEQPVVAVIPKVVVLPPAGPASAIVSAPVETAGMTPGSGISPPAADLHGKQILVVKGEEQPVTAPDAKKAVHKPKHVTDRIADNSGGIPAENSQDLQLKTVSPQQRAEGEYRKANLALQEGRTNDALADYENALLIDSSHKDARKAWVALLISLKRNEDAERVLQKGLKRDPHDASFAMLMARLQVERGAMPLALETLQKTLPYAEDQADYQAFLAALLQRQNLQEEAVAHYQVALKLAPNNGIWLMGLGISLQALKRNDDARNAYQRALASNSLSAQLQAFVQNKLKEL
ncbi:tetratricopeptide repeat protein [Sideroxydans sp. CL21]|uniref:tetratricopeptide repeat protein n=1 Tax=Sideroxydans sp. CL21 TaxID=2600596 RepID=UPI0024BC992B|nr:tetratricopeptide repeat protein [Sideroxydans sp. CL21]